MSIDDPESPTTPSQDADMIVVEMPEPWVEPHTPCACRVCAFAMANDHLAKGHWDCHYYPRAGSEAGEDACSDPHGVGCECPGTLDPGAPCEACQLARDGGVGWQDWRPEGPGEYALWVMFTEGDTRPATIVDERAWPYTSASLAKLERICGIPADRAREVLEDGTMICTRLMWVRRVPIEATRDPNSLRSQPMPRTLIAAELDEGVVFHEPCDCPLCVVVATHGWLEESHMDCNDYPEYGGSGPCSDPHKIGCRCPGTGMKNKPCEACGAYDDPEQVARIVEGRAEP